MHLILYGYIIRLWRNNFFLIDRNLIGQTIRKNFAANRQQAKKQISIHLFPKPRWEQLKSFHGNVCWETIAMKDTGCQKVFICSAKRELDSVIQCEASFCVRFLGAKFKHSISKRIYTFRVRIRIVQLIRNAILKI